MNKDTAAEVTAKVSDTAPVQLSAPLDECHWMMQQSSLAPALPVF